MRITRIFAGGLVGAAIIAALSGCTGEPAVQVYGELTEICFSTATTADTATEGYLAYISVSVVNTSPRDVILREARPLELVNAEVTDMVVVPTDEAFTSFGYSPGGRLSADQRPLWNNRVAVNGVTIKGGKAVDVVLEVRARDFTEYAGIKGMHVKYDDGWFSATSSAGTTAGFVPPWSHCGAARR